MTTSQHPLYGAFEHALLVAMDRDYADPVRADAARAVCAVASLMNDRPARVDFRLLNLASTNLDAPHVSVEIIRTLAKLEVHAEPARMCEPLTDSFVALALEAVKQDAGAPLFELLQVLLQRAPDHVAAEWVKGCAELLVDAPDDTAGRLLLRWLRSPGFDAEWTRAFLLAHPDVMLRAGFARFRGLHQLAPVPESWALVGDFAAKVASRPGELVVSAGLFDPGWYGERAEEALATLRAAAASRDGTLAGGVLLRWADEFGARIAGLPFEGTSGITAQTFGAAIAVVTDNHSPLLERLDAAILLRAVAPLMREPVDRDRNDLLSAAAATVHQPDLRRPVLEAIDLFGPHAPTGPAAWTGPDPERLLQIARESIETSLAPLCDTVRLLLRRGLPVDDDTARTCLEQLVSRPAEAAAFVELWIASAGTIVPGLREWLDAHFAVVEAGGLEVAERLHLRAPTAASWRALAALTRGGSPSRALDPLAYEDRAPLALAALTEALEKEQDGPVRAYLGGWLVMLFSNIHRASAVGAELTFESLSDRDVRRMVGARNFLRGLDLERRGEVSLGEHTPRSARGRVGDLDVDVLLDDGRLDARCPCPATQNAQAPCKHAAALIVALRTRLRGRRPAGAL